MNVFISWSGERSRVIAEELRTWLKDVVHILDTFMSEHDIQKGANWIDVLDDKLKHGVFAILVLTPENRDAPWINYEAGAVHKGIKENKIATLLLDVDYGDLPSTLSKFNGANCDRDGLLAVVKSINSELKDRALDPGTLKRSFVAHWPRMEKIINGSYTSAPARKSMTEEIVTRINKKALLKNEWVSYCQSNQRSWSGTCQPFSNRSAHFSM